MERLAKFSGRFFNGKEGIVEDGTNQGFGRSILESVRDSGGRGSRGGVPGDSNSRPKRGARPFVSPGYTNERGPILSRNAVQEKGAPRDVGKKGCLNMPRPKDSDASSSARAQCFLLEIPDGERRDRATGNCMLLLPLTGREKKDRLRKRERR